MTYNKDKPITTTEIRNREWNIQKEKYNLLDGVPCNHPGCMAHTSHPCEKCGRYNAINLILDKYK